MPGLLRVLNTAFCQKTCRLELSFMQQVVEHLASLEQRRNSLREVGVAGGTVGVGVHGQTWRPRESAVTISQSAAHRFEWRQCASSRISSLARALSSDRA